MHAEYLKRRCFVKNYQYLIFIKQIKLNLIEKKKKKKSHHPEPYNV